jgi:HsdM N-terminal domain
MRLTQQQLEAHLWGAANILRGKTAGQDYKNYILSLMFYKRLCDQWEHEADEAIAIVGKGQPRFPGARKWAAPSIAGAVGSLNSGFSLPFCTKRTFSIGE